jgi:hypothetical protein
MVKHTSKSGQKLPPKKVDKINTRCRVRFYNLKLKKIDAHNYRALAVNIQ